MDVDAGVVAEVERLLRLADEGDYPALLGVSPSATEKDRKIAYVKLVAKYHPDRFSKADSDFRAKLSSVCAGASEAVTEFEKFVDARKREQEAGAPSPATNGNNGDGPDGMGNAGSKMRFARELYGRALTSYDQADYWDAIQLARQAIEVDGQEAEYHALLGRALSQNRKWRKQAADSFLKASELEPTNVDYLGMLGAIYRSEGLTTRANSLLAKARAIQPDFELPELDGEAEVTTT